MGFLCLRFYPVFLRVLSLFTFPFFAPFLLLVLFPPPIPHRRALCLCAEITPSCWCFSIEPPCVCRFVFVCVARLPRVCRSLPYQIKANGSGTWNRVLLGKKKLLYVSIFGYLGYVTDNVMLSLSLQVFWSKFPSKSSWRGIFSPPPMRTRWKEGSQRIRASRLYWWKGMALVVLVWPPAMRFSKSIGFCLFLTCKHPTRPQKSSDERQGTD